MTFIVEFSQKWPSLRVAVSLECFKKVAKEYPLGTMRGIEKKWELFQERRLNSIQPVSILTLHTNPFSTFQQEPSFGNVNDSMSLSRIWNGGVQIWF